MAFTYNDPIIWAEYAIEVAKACHAVGIKTVAVTAGYVTPQARGPFFEHIDAANVDLKAFTEVFYQHLTLSHLQPVLDTLQWLRHESNVWFEITNLIIPQENDTDEEFQRLCDFVLDKLGDDVPVHFTAFHPDFRMQDRPSTPMETLLRAYELAKQRGLKHVYTGNVDDVKHQSTYCAGCGQLVIERNWYALGQYNLHHQRCRHCQAELAGQFADGPGNWGRQRQPIRIAEFQPNLPVINQPPKEIPHMPSDTQPPPQLGPTASDLSISDNQKKELLQVTSQLIVDALLGRNAQIAADLLVGVADQPVLGTFVTLKRQSRLRACCGNVGRTMRLVESLQDAVVATATRDGRLPPISMTELPFLDVSVSLLHGLQPVERAGPERVDAIEVGRHGLQVIRGQSRGLLLPSVATENGLDAERFLDQVCLKANLPPKAWKDSDTTLLTFEAAVTDGSFVIDEGQVIRSTVPRLLDSDQLRQLANHCLGNVINMVRGATPSYYFPQVPDGNVQGIGITLENLPQNRSLRAGRLSMRPGVPLQSTLTEICGQLAQSLVHVGLAADQVPQITLQLAVLTDPAMNGTVAQPDLRGVEPSRRCVLVMQGRSWSWMFDPNRPADQLLVEAAAPLEMDMPQSGIVLSLDTAATTTPMSLSETPTPQRGNRIRPAAVAGQFYPAETKQLDDMLDGFLADGSSGQRVWPAAMVPHAGWRFSGQIAADVFARLKFPETIIVIGPTHTNRGVSFAVAPHDVWQIPGAELKNNLDLARQLVESVPQFQLDAQAHASEHAIEVELPFLARLAPHSKVVGITVGAGDLQTCEQIASGMAGVLRNHADDVLLLISSDMNHFATDGENRRLDSIALAALDQLDPDRIFEVVRGNNISMCGLLPAVIVLKTLQKLNRLQIAERVSYATSADVSGDTSRVVGYAGMLFG